MILGKGLHLVEEEKLYDENSGIATEPFNPKDIDILSQTMTIYNIMCKLRYDEIVLNPDFQRLPNLWNDEKQSRLIESLIIGIPLPTFYFDMEDNGSLIVVDGLQRLTAIKRFSVLEKNDPQKLKLTGLEYLQEYNGYYYEDLPPRIRRKINERTIIAYLVRSGTPEKVRISIFTRINAGGLTLEPAEIKNSVYRGHVTDLLKSLASTKEFRMATQNKISPLRMLDCEFVNRFLAFYVLGVEQYRGNLEDYLNDVLIVLKRASKEEMNKYRIAFIKAMDYAYQIFGEKAFRKLGEDHNYGQINKPLFDAVAVTLAKLEKEELDLLFQRKETLLKQYEETLVNAEFAQSISNGTAKIVNVRKRHETISKLFEGIIKYSD